MCSGKPRDLACNIPQRNVDAGQRLQWHPLLSVIAHQIVDLVPDHIAIQRVHPQNHWLNNPFDNALVGQSDIARTKTFTPAGDALIGFNLDQMGRPFGIILLRIAKRLRQVVAQNMTRNAGDFHEFSRPNVVVSSARVIRFFTR